MNAFTKEDLKRFQSESLPDKEQRSLANISAWFSYWKNEVYVAFSGGKDSSVLADLCAFWCKVIGATLYLVFVNTGLEYPEIQRHVKEFAEYLRKKYDIEVVLEILRPKMRFDEVIKTYGYPMISKEVSLKVANARKGGVYAADFIKGSERETRCGGRYSLVHYRPLLDTDFLISNRCCDVMKKNPSHEYAKRTGRKPITAQMADESRIREQQWIKHGCNGFNMSSPISNPMSFWTEQDVLQYIKQHDIPIASVYGEIEYANNPEQIRIEDLGIECECCEELCTTGCQRTGCIFCGFGCHLEASPNRFERLKVTHPRQYEYCIGGGEYDENGTWRPNAKGLGMGHVFEELNKIYGEGFIKY
jgi:3'-phosphoadenosine 5'-phosphosulfate sulfotransferase (PAPS reductase)/FAD synthetase